MRNPFRQLNRNAVLFSAYWACITFGNIGIVGVLFNLYLLRLGYAPAFIGMLTGAGQAVWAAFCLPAGWVGMRLGLKRALNIAILMHFVVISLVVAAASLPPAWRTAGISAAWMLYWVSVALAAVNSTPYMMAVTNDETRSLSFTVQQAAGAVAAFLGGLAAGALPGLIASRLGTGLNGPLPYQLGLLFALPAYLLGALVFSRALAAALPGVPEAHDQAQRGMFKTLALLMLIVIFQAVSDGAIRSFFNVYMDQALHVATVRIGVVMGVAQLLPLLFLLLTPALLKRWGSGTGLAIAILLCALFMLLIAGVPTWQAASVAFMGMMGSVAIVNTARGLFSQEIVPAHRRTVSSAVTTLGNALGWSAASWMGGLLVVPIGFRGVFLLSAVLAILASSMLFLRFRHAD